MIRQYQPTDLESIMQLWLENNLQYHPFIDAEFFKQNYELVKMFISMSEVYVQDLNGIKGFIGISDNYISGLYVADDCQKQGTGKALVDKAKQLHNELLVHVYNKNPNAIAFFQSQHFEPIAESINEENGEQEILMRCNVEHRIKIGKCAL